jgi:hypothetical protein
MSEANGKRAITIGTGNLSTLTFITFLVLKLMGVITWSWWWVTAPLLGGIAFVLGIFVLVGIIGLIAYLVKR